MRLMQAFLMLYSLYLYKTGAWILRISLSRSIQYFVKIQYFGTTLLAELHNLLFALKNPISLDVEMDD